MIRVQNNRLRWDYWTYKSVVSSHNKGYNKQEFQGKQKVAEEERGLDMLYRRTGLYMVMIVVLALAAAICIKMTAVSQGEISNQAQIQYEKDRMKEYTGQLRSYLSLLGYTNSGVTVTRTTFEDGSRTYTAKIHHTYIDKMDDDQQEELLVQLAALPAPATVCHEFLLANP